MSSRIRRRHRRCARRASSAFAKQAAAPNRNSQPAGLSQRNTLANSPAQSSGPYVTQIPQLEVAGPGASYAGQAASGSAQAYGLSCSSSGAPVIRLANVDIVYAPMPSTTSSAFCPV